MDYHLTYLRNLHKKTAEVLKTSIFILVGRNEDETKSENYKFFVFVLSCITLAYSLLFIVGLYWNIFKLLTFCFGAKSQVNELADLPENTNDEQLSSEHDQDLEREADSQVQMPDSARFQQRLAQLRQHEEEVKRERDNLADEKRRLEQEYRSFQDTKNES